MPTESTSNYPCPSCGFLVFECEPGSYEICPICDWEDDAVQLRYPLAGGANAPLVEYQRSALATLSPVRLRELAGEGFVRCLAWRPLTADDLKRAPNGPTDGRSYFDTLSDDIPAYYWEVQR